MSALTKLLMTSRILAAVFGGYFLANVVGVFLAFSLPVSAGNAFVAGVLLSFAVWVVGIMWCFYASSALKAWLGLLVPSFILAVLSWAINVFS